MNTLRKAWVPKKLSCYSWFMAFVSMSCHWQGLPARLCLLLFLTSYYLNIVLFDKFIMYYDYSTP